MSDNYKRTWLWELLKGIVKEELEAEKSLKESLLKPEELKSNMVQVLMGMFKGAKSDNEKMQMAEDYDMIVDTFNSGNVDLAVKLLTDSKLKELAKAAMKDQNRQILKKLPKGVMVMKHHLKTDGDLSIKGFSGRKTAYKL